MTGVTNVPSKLLGMVQQICRLQINLYGIVNVAVVMSQMCLQSKFTHGLSFISVNVFVNNILRENQLNLICEFLCCTDTNCILLCKMTQVHAS